MAENYGLLNNIASGLKEGLIAYQTQQNINRQNNLQNLMMGVQQGPDGNLDYTPEMKIKKEAERKQNELAIEGFNPESASSKAARGLLSQAGLEVPDSISASQLKQFEPVLNAKIKGDLTNEYRKDVIDEKRQKAKDKASEQQEKTYTELVNKIQTPRGNSSVQTAQNALRSVQNAKELIGQYPDLNNMPQDQVNLLRSEIAKIATGGVATEGAMRELGTPTFVSSWNQFMSRSKNQPTGAELGEFLKNNVNYLNGLEASNRKVVNEFQKHVYGGYKNRLTKEQRDRFENDEFPDLFKSDVSSGLLNTSPGAQSDSVRMIDPKGNVRLVPKSQVDKALKAGGKLAP